MSTRRHVLQLAAGAVLAAIGSGRPQDSVSAEVIETTSELVGQLMLFNPQTKTVSAGRISFLASSAGQCEIVLEDFDQTEAERLTSPRNDPSVDVTQLMDAIQRVFRSFEV